MASNDDGPRRDNERREDNPFIAFRRFADSQVSSLLNSVFTLPATIANFNNVHHAREQCLFGRADHKQCEELQDIESKVAKIRSEGRELYRVGDLQEVLKKGEELMKLDRQADKIRKNIVEASRSRDLDSTDARAQADLIEKVANEKGQQWGWSWSWSYPKPFEEERDSDARSEGDKKGGNPWCAMSIDVSMDHLEKKLEQLDRDLEKKFDEFDKAYTKDSPGQSSGFESQLPYLYSPRSLEEDRQMGKAGVLWRDAFEDLLRVQQGADLIPEDQLGHSKRIPYSEWTRRFWDPSWAASEVNRQRANYPRRVPWEGEETNEEPNYEYEHDHEDQHDDPPFHRPGQSSSDQPATELDAYERFLAPTESKMPTKPSILSTLTTTERTVAPDGTVTTKVVLKKRFADGREESSETVHTSRGQDDDAQPRDPWKAMQDAQFPSKELTDKKNEDKKKGWFWSN
ncbi:hypothetical protein BS50DRAFT_541354 [Corynespora cassiicola Philippines]|uniref:Uncharacterized protein n=1 Tax=Corynespora cassiicola Philippines TaxID=1448308 RepID=A0A2T2PCG4_CORCC|nr:hypothetical protein BS50DRAFT_541354 [Corynespora cassiicola Philippines]